MKKLNTRKIRDHKLAKNKRSLQMLTCYDFQTAGLLDQSELDLILVGDSVGNVILGYETTVEVSLEEMVIFCSAVKRGAPNKFVVGDLPFGSYATLEKGIDSAIQLFQKSKVEAVKLEGAYPTHLNLVRELTRTGIPVMGHIGLTPQSVHELGGYYLHGKDQKSEEFLIQSALDLENAGAFSVVLECVHAPVAEKITKLLSIPTIGIGSGVKTDGQVLVINDLLKLGQEAPPQFCSPVADLFQVKKELISTYLTQNQKVTSDESHLNH
ncbi:MAG: 3-methyl-2-oxobutanoate hydroxymethyltransferase [Halobacteriovoraceae bacterium]|jgi:3-methyl-2-oxobutanoate hydroxymethyltransferase|nr:3-methyl-2-oxobutanoate hydroxymethyltransferase [Halobacteriovoraceae bacterium]MBT5094451.1 3-methyl-2-oxobutanoate hydroxymethyltransferase [Halobacteriovoraceae bacterium]